MGRGSVSEQAGSDVFEVHFSDRGDRVGLIGRWWESRWGGKTESEVFAKDDSAFSSGCLNRW